ncbi:MAG: DUF3489 domain-containing protein [Terricaulis sp.]
MAKAAKRRSIRPAKQAKSKPTRRPQSNEKALSKLDQVVNALRAPKGASITDLMALTGWQIHSVRGAIAGALKKKRGLTVTSTKTDGERVYRITGRP